MRSCNNLVPGDVLVNMADRVHGDAATAIVVGVVVPAPATFWRGRADKEYQLLVTDEDGTTRFVQLPATWVKGRYGCISDRQAKP